MTFKQITHRLNRRDLRLLPKLSSPLKISLIILLAFTAILTTRTIFAQEAANPIKAKQDAMLKGNNQESWLDNAMGSNITSLQIMVAGTFPDSILNGEITPDKLSSIYVPGGMIGTANQIAAATFTPSASGIEYIAQLKNNFLGKPVYAADKTGFEGLTGIMNLWKMSRNIVYVLISLYFVVLGIMIMLRIKISPQAVVTIQSSLPKIVTTLVIVTFSYAIAGLCIDLINFLQPFAILLLFKTLGKNLGENLFPLSWGDWSLTGIANFIRSWFGDNAFNYNALVNTDFMGILGMTSRLAPNIILLLLGAMAGGIIAAMTGAAAIAATGVAAPVALGAIGVGVAAGAGLTVLIVTIIIYFYLLKLLFSLVKCYITILLNIIFAPFQIFMGIFPGSKGGFSKWITTLIANLIVFPACILFLILANILSQNIHGGLWAPHIIVGDIWFLPIIFGIAAIGLLSKLPTLIPEAVFNIKPSPFGKAIGEGLSSIPIVSGAAKMAVSGVKEFAGEAIGTRIGTTKFGEAISGKKRTTNEEKRAEAPVPASGSGSTDDNLDLATKKVIGVNDKED